MASRLCKAAMLSRFNLLAKEAKRDDLLKAGTYYEAKVSFANEKFAASVGLMNFSSTFQSVISGLFLSV